MRNILCFFVLLSLTIITLPCRAQPTVLTPKVDAWINAIPRGQPEGMKPSEGLPLIVLIDLGSKDLIVKKVNLNYQSQRWSPSVITRQNEIFRIDGRTNWTPGAELELEIFIYDSSTKKESVVKASTKLGRAS